MVKIWSTPMLELSRKKLICMPLVVCYFAPVLTELELLVTSMVRTIGEKFPDLFTSLFQLPNSQSRCSSCPNHWRMWQGRRAEEVKRTNAISAVCVLIKNLETMEGTDIGHRAEAMEETNATSPVRVLIKNPETMEGKDRGLLELWKEKI
ncbi:unnamed protein product [Linum tenue]|uniref:Uncharacterized protein n=1 Tax=Linum tenue TaxID=586396 RepID=A0AAV0LYY8_9ROSI|nr:unnamed protein product [Linum tenue]